VLPFAAAVEDPRHASGPAARNVVDGQTRGHFSDTLRGPGISQVETTTRPGPAEPLNTVRANLKVCGPGSWAIA